MEQVHQLPYLSLVVVAAPVEGSRRVARHSRLL